MFPCSGIIIIKWIVLKKSFSPVFRITVKSKQIFKHSEQENEIIVNLIKGARINLYNWYNFY